MGGNEKLLSVLLLCSSSLLRPFCVFIAAAPNERKQINATNSRSHTRQGVSFRIFVELPFLERLRFAKCVRDLISVQMREAGGELIF